VIGSDSNARALPRSNVTAGQLANNNLEYCFGFQVGLAAAVIESFVTQLKLLSTMMMSFPFTWFTGEMRIEHMQPAEQPAAPQPVTVDLSSVPNVAGPEVLPARRKARKAKADKSGMQIA